MEFMHSDSLDVPFEWDIAALCAPIVRSKYSKARTVLVPVLLVPVLPVRRRHL
jgi:hypothetical protein